MTLIQATTPEHRALWDELLRSHPAGSGYLLSWYLEHQRLPRTEVEIWLFVRDGKAAAGAVLYCYSLPGGARICQVPSGPIARAGQHKCLGELVAAIRARATELGATLLQFEAFEPEVRDVLRDTFAGADVRDEPIWKMYHPTLWREYRVMLEGKTSETLLASFDTSTRRHLREAAKSDVDIRTITEDGDVATAYALWNAGAARTRYTIRTAENFQSLIRAMWRHDGGVLLVSYVEGQAAAFVHSVFHGQGSVYISGAHRPEVSSTFGARVLQYRAMCLALERGIRWYSLGGPATGGIREFKERFRPVLVDNMRFVTVLLKPLRAKLLKSIIGRTSWMHAAKRWVARKAK
ncbi:MAG: peptidoglycan bridge formation glycyltransferase FemA/FemB family protein [Phycisphaerae bacterium]|nr:aminoacyltransferase [Phycisphaerae bacterium]NUQ47250.1 peptidoglycan bridge formation glycyltransferase FemA/FemB family protein [Phycisphaerae bacterium]